MGGMGQLMKPIREEPGAMDRRVEKLRMVIGIVESRRMGTVLWSELGAPDTQELH